MFVAAFMLLSSGVWAEVSPKKEKNINEVQDVEQVKCKVHVTICGKPYEFPITTTTEKDCKNIQSTFAFISLFLQNCD